VRISELSRISGVPTATIKYYLREKLLPEGRRTSATQAQYDEGHVDRLRLIRALLGPGGLSVAKARLVLDAIDGAATPSTGLLGVAHCALVEPADPDRDLGRAEELLRRWGWTIDPKDRDSRAAFLDALEAIDAAGFDLPAGALDAYAQAMLQVAAMELDNLPTDSPGSAVRYVVLGTVLNEPLILALRRLAEQHVATVRFGPAETPSDPPETRPRLNSSPPGRPGRRPPGP
jgi:DNA-binding transcriptional MerR regulator